MQVSLYSKCANMLNNATYKTINCIRAYIEYARISDINKCKDLRTLFRVDNKWKGLTDELHKKEKDLQKEKSYCSSSLPIQE